jgi:hypothetical protein
MRLEYKQESRNRATVKTKGTLDTDFKRIEYKVMFGMLYLQL